MEPFNINNSNSKDNLLYLDKILSNPYTKVLIYGGNDLYYRGVIKGDFNITIGSDFKSFYESSAMEKLNDYVVMASSAMAVMSSDYSVPNVRLKSPGMTQLIWMGQVRPVFNLQVIFISYKSNKNILTDVKRLYATVLPKQTGFGQIFLAPLGYNGGGMLRENPKGTVSLQIGNWFLAHHLVVTNVSLDFNRVVTNNGVPIAVEGYVDLTPYIDVSYDKFMGYFRI